MIKSKYTTCVKILVIIVIKIKVRFQMALKNP